MLSKPQQNGRRGQFRTKYMRARVRARLVQSRAAAVSMGFGGTVGGVQKRNALIPSASQE